MDEKMRIVIFLYQYSVVVKGIERRLADLGYEVEMITDVTELVGKTASTNLFILYLPADIMEDRTKQVSIGQICDMVKKGERNLIILGEKKYHSELLERVTQLEAFAWYDRPVPADQFAEAVDMAIHNKGGVPAGKKRVLIVDDDPSYAGMVREWIKEKYRADVVTAGMQAITFLLKNPVDMILLDYEMPVVDGPQVLQMLRQEPATAQIPVVFLTGNGTQEAVQRVMSLKPHGYILKSTTRENLLDFLKKRLG